MKRRTIVFIIGLLILCLMIFLTDWTAALESFKEGYEAGRGG